MKKVVSFSGGRTSAYLCYLMKEKYGDEVDFIYMDTGAEHPKTYDFIRKVNDHLGLNLVCLRMVTNPALGKANTYAVVDINEIGCDLEPWKDAMSKYGTPYVHGPFCTRVMKLEPFERYCKDNYPSGYHTYLGIRSDEPKRLKVRDGVSYLADISDFDKQDVINWWKSQPFDLEIPEHLGNCVFCIKKGINKVALAAKDEPKLAIEFMSAINCESVRVVSRRQQENKIMYRGNNSLESIIATYSEHSREDILSSIRGSGGMDSGSCSESCEAFSCDADTQLKVEDQGEIVDIFNTDKKYSVIYCDPAWQFKSAKTGGKLNSGAAQKYTVTSLKDMMRLPVESLAAEDCLLVMWYVGAMPREAIELCEFWGFKLLNMNGFVWDKETKTGKDHFGMGYATRASTESALIGYRGKLSNIIQDRSVRSKIRAKVGRHSEKPNEFREAIVKICGDVPRIELFSREQFPGWDAWGNELEMMNKQVTA